MIRILKHLVLENFQMIKITQIRVLNLSNLYIDTCKGKYSKNNTNNANCAAYAFITFEFNDANQKCTVLIANKDFLFCESKQSTVQTIPCISSDQFINPDKYDYLKKNENRVIQKFDEFCAALRFGTERNQLDDDELRILGTLFTEHKTIQSCLNKRVPNKLKIKVFTFMDMCQYCYTAWSLLYDKLLDLYKSVYKNSCLVIDCSVYSIKPYINKSCEIMNSMNISISLKKDVQKPQDEAKLELKFWKEVHSKYTRRQITLKDDNRDTIKIK